MCSVCCCFVCCLFVAPGFWYTFVVTHVFWRVPKSQIFDALRKLRLMIIHVKTRFVLLLLALLPQL